MSVDPHITNNVVTRDTTKFNLFIRVPQKYKVYLRPNRWIRLPTLQFFDVFNTQKDAEVSSTRHALNILHDLRLSSILVYGCFACFKVMIKFEDKRQLILDGFDAYGVRHRLRAGHFHPSTGVSKSLLGCSKLFFGNY